MSSELRRIINDLEEGLKGEHRGVMPIPIVDLKAMLPALKSAALLEGFSVEVQRHEHNEEALELSRHQQELIARSIKLQEQANDRQDMAVRSQIETNEAHVAAVQAQLETSNRVADALESLVNIVREWEWKR